MSELPKAAIIRLAKSAGAERVSDDAADELVKAVEAYAARLAKKATAIAENGKRKTLKADDVKLAI